MSDKACEHDWHYIAGIDAFLSLNTGIESDYHTQRVCSKCEMCSLKSSLVSQWIDVGFLKDHYPEDDVKNYVGKN